MKRNEMICMILFVMLSILPVASGIMAIFDYRLTVHYDSVPTWICGVVFVGAAMYLVMAPHWQSSGLITILTALMLPLSVVGLYVNMWKSGQIGMTAAAALCVAGSGILVYKRVRPKWLKLVSAGLSGILLLPFGFVVFVFFTFGQIGQNTVVATVPSPDGSYSAEVVDSDQGALGGDTVVWVYHEDTRMDCYFFEIQKAPQRVYLGEWGEYKDMKVYWEAERILNINGASYEIS